MATMTDTAELAGLLAAEVLVETNSGTYSAREAAAAVGTGDPRFADRNVYSRVDGTMRATGPDEAVAPGRMRQLHGAKDELRSLRTRVARLRHAK